MSGYPGKILDMADYFLKALDGKDPDGCTFNLRILNAIIHPISKDNTPYGCFVDCWVDGNNNDDEAFGLVIGTPQNEDELPKLDDIRSNGGLISVEITRIEADVQLGYLRDNVPDAPKLVTGWINMVPLPKEGEEPPNCVRWHEEMRAMVISSFDASGRVLAPQIIALDKKGQKLSRTETNALIANFATSLDTKWTADASHRHAASRRYH